jgi:hypothetical protein
MFGGSGLGVGPLKIRQCYRLLGLASQQRKDKVRWNALKDDVELRVTRTHNGQGIVVLPHLASIVDSIKTYDLE